MSIVFIYIDGEGSAGDGVLVVGPVPVLHIPLRRLSRDGFTQEHVRHLVAARSWPRSIQRYNFY